VRHILLHGHIFKNAGTTFDWALRKNFGKNFLDHRKDKLMRAEGRAHLEELISADTDLCALSSHHMTRDLPEIENCQFIQVYLLRHPIERVRSVYDFERKQRGLTPGAKAAKSKSFRDYVAWRMLPTVAHTIRNYQTLYLAGNHGLADDGQIATQYFPEAVAAVNQGSLIGLVERYDESMVMLEESLRESFPDLDLSYVAQNVSKGKRRKKAPLDGVARTLEDLGDLQSTIIDKNSFDLALYQMAVQRLDAKITHIDHFDDKLADFQERCQQLRGRKIIGR
jgi:hypothetical protein